jgi:hypothetical protein
MAQISKRKNNFEMKFAGMRSFGKLFILLLFIAGCSEQALVKPDIGFSYFPIQVGDFSIYNVEQTDIISSNSTTYSFQLRVTVTDSVLESNTLTYFLKREKRDNSTSNWIPFETWSVRLTEDEIIQNENNIWFVKLIFPLSQRVKWNGNVYNNLDNNGNLFNGIGSDQYFISEFNKPVTLNSGFQSDETITVVHNNFSDDIVGVDKRLEMYSKHVGLIYKEVTQLEYCTSTACIGQQKPVKGTILMQTLIEHGTL